MTQKGEHTWDLVIDYQRCPQCGFIIESREGFQYRLGKWEKDVECPRCAHRFSVVSNRKVRFGPLIGAPEPRSFDYDADA